ncbi:MAG TPA: hypothetical protein VD837_08755 [Terriglobales bacterium]|nr:hypothetical protein [Terriglobales bacterium]
MSDKDAAPANTGKIILMLLLAGLTVHSQVKPTAGERLKAQHPAVEWNLASAVTVDIDCDGKPDSFLWGVDKHVTREFVISDKPVRQIRQEIVLGLERGGSPRTQTENIPFRKDTGYYGFCSLPKTIEVKPLSCDWEQGLLPGCSANNRCEALWIRDDECGEFFVFWDASRRRMIWVRH